MVKIAVLASFNMDLVMRTERRPERGETLQGEFAMHLGGKGFNQAVAARRLGAEVVVTGRVGDDEFGRMFLGALDLEGIDRRAVVVDAEAGTGVAAIVVDAAGENAIVQAPRANRGVTRAQIEEHAAGLFEGADVAVLQLETSEEAARAFISSGRERGVRALLNPAPASVAAGQLVTHADIIIANEIEADAIAGTRTRIVDDARGTAVAIAPSGAIAVVTLGEGGAVAASGADVMHAPSCKVAAIDTVGAGDAFCAAFAVRTAEGASLADAMRFASAAGALACTKQGAYPSMPYRDEVEALLAAQGGTR
jgi:ribokinase